MLGGLIMIIGAILQATSFSYAQLVVARIVTGLGNGLNVSDHLLVFRLLRFSQTLDIDSALVSRGVLQGVSTG